MTRLVTLPPAPAAPVDGKLPGGWWHTDGDRVVCDLCPRACRLRPGDRGFCFVRENDNGAMILSTYGRSTGFCIDPIEKKPLNHFYPGTSVLSFGTAGCNLGCKFCQNWDISKSKEVARLSEQASPAAIAEAALHHDCKSVAFTYNDPVVWAEYAIDTARACRARGVKTVAVTAGYITPEARGPFFEFMDAANVDLKAFSQQFYHEITYSHLQPVLDTLAWLAKETQVWFEITNLVIPQANDSADEIRKLAGWVAAHCGPEVPLHFTAFHPDFRMRDRLATPIETLLKAYDLARAEGLKHVYTGNVDDVTHQSTYCAGCGERVIERNWYELGAYHLAGNACKRCGHALAGRFDPAVPGRWGRRRQPVDISGFDAAPRSTSPSSEGSMKITTSPSAASTAVSLSAEQQTAILDAASELVASAILGRTPRIADPTLAGAAEKLVMGAYVTLKRGGHLRACTGNLGRPCRLIDALTQAAVHTATQDHRLPPISPGELPFLEISVNLLHNLRTLDAQGKDRAGEIIVGKHGLRIRQRDAGGLLLPVVATDHAWDAENFLRQLCRKAGLISTAWEEPDAVIQTFESLEFGGPFHAEVPDHRLHPKALERELGHLAEHARTNLLALSRGMTPSFYIHGIGDGHVSGLALTVEGTHAAGPWHFTRLALRPGLPVQATLFSLCESAAQALAGQALPERLHVGVTLLTDPALHGTLEQPDLRGFDPTHRALLAIDQDRMTWLFDPDASVEELVTRARNVLDPAAPARTQLYSLAAHTSEPRVVFDNVPRPVEARGARPPAVAGRFYPGDPGRLGALVTDLLATSPHSPERWAAAMVPHAGLSYSGKVAAAVFNRLAIPRRVLILGPKHTRLGVNWAVAPHQAWTIPGTQLAADPELAQQLVDAIPGLQLDAGAHQQEHAIEVELPFLARLAPEAKVTGIAIGQADWAHCERFATGLARVISALEEPPLLLISSDMNHFAPDRDTRVLDATALDAMATLDPKRLLDTVTSHDISMCGVIPAVIVMETLRQLDQLRRCERVAYATSFDAGGEPGRVVGYAGVLLG